MEISRIDFTSSKYFSLKKEVTPFPYNWLYEIYTHNIIENTIFVNFGSTTS